MKPRSLIVSLALALAPHLVAAQATTPCDLVQQPATRIRSDSVPGVGRVSFIGGAVLIKCPARGITLRGDSAEMFPDHDQMIGHAVYDEPRFHVTADFLNYFPLDERVVAAANVHARLPSGSTLDGPQAEYKSARNPRIRTRPQMSAIARPTIHIVQQDSAGKPTPPMTVIANTVLVDGDSTDAQIYAGGQVQIDRDSVSATADSAHIDQPKETMRLMRNPVVRGKKGKPFTLKGDLIDMYSTNRKLNRVVSRANATAVSDSMTLKSDTIDLRVRNDLLDHAFAWGAKRAEVVSPSQHMLADSLDVSMPGQRIQLVKAFRKALAQGKPDTTRFLIEKPDTADWLAGDTITAHFDTLAARGDTTKNPDIRQLVAKGNASSLYHMAPNDSAERRPALNHVTARVITINFDDRKVATVTTVDSVSGIYIEPRPDSTARRNGTNAAAQPNQQQTPKPGQKPAVPSSVVPLPTKPPTKPPTRP